MMQIDEEIPAGEGVCEAEGLDHESEWEDEQDNDGDSDPEAARIFQMAMLDVQGRIGTPGEDPKLLTRKSRGILRAASMSLAFLEQIRDDPSGWYYFARDEVVAEMDKLGKMVVRARGANFLP